MNQRDLRALLLRMNDPDEAVRAEASAALALQKRLVGRVLAIVDLSVVRPTQPQTSGPPRDSCLRSLGLNLMLHALVVLMLMRRHAAVDRIIYRSLTQVAAPERAGTPTERAAARALLLQPDERAVPLLIDAMWFGDEALCRDVAPTLTMLLRRRLRTDRGRLPVRQSARLAHLLSAPYIFAMPDLALAVLDTVVREQQTWASAAVRRFRAAVPKGDAYEPLKRAADQAFRAVRWRRGPRCERRNERVR